RRERASELEKVAKLPRAEREKGFADAAKRLGEDADELAEEFTEAETTAPPIKGRETWTVEPWPEPVATDALVTAIKSKLSKHVAFYRPQQLTAVTLWTLYDWIHHHPKNAHSIFLVPVSQDPDSGKTRLMKTLFYLTVRPFICVEPTGPNVYRTVDAHQPTFMVDEADNLVTRKSDVTDIVNASWSRKVCIRRAGHDFDPFCPKVIAAQGQGNSHLPRATFSRSLRIEMFPAQGEVDELWNELDDDEFAELRRKLARWSADNIEKIVAAKPKFPDGFANRYKANWKPLLAIAEDAGKDWVQQAHDAASYLLRGAYEPSWGVRAMAEMDAMFQKRLKTAANADKVYIFSEELPKYLLADPLSPWHEYKTDHKRGPISQNQIAALLRGYHIYPTTIHPKGRSDNSPRGYRWKDCRDMLARYRNRFALVRDDKKR